MKDISDVLHYLHNRTLKIDEVEVKMWIRDGGHLDGRDVIEFYLLFEEPDTGLIVKDSFEVSRSLFLYDINAGMNDFVMHFMRFSDYVRRCINNTDYECEEIEI